MRERQKAIKTALFSLVSNITLAFIKATVGYYGHSQALIADAVESCGDVLSSLILLLGIKYSYRPSNSKYPYGYGKIETLVSFVSVGFLFSSAFMIAWESLDNILAENYFKPQAYTLWVLAPIILWKEVSFRIMMRDAIATHSSSLKAEAWHHRSDAMTSVAAFIGIAMTIFLGQAFEGADNYAALFASAGIAYHAYELFKTALGEAIDVNDYEELVNLVREIAHKQNEVSKTEKCFIRKSGMQYHLDLHIWVDGDKSVREGHQIAHDLKRKLAQKLPQLGNILIHVEPDDN